MPEFDAYKITLNVFVGLAIFMYGMSLMTNSLKSLSLGGLKRFMGKATSNRFKGLFVGFGVTSIIQSSSATSVIVIGLINIGVLTLGQAIPIIFGANIGTTVTAQLIAFKLSRVTPYLIIGGLLTHFVAKSVRRKNIGLAMFGFGMLFFGLSHMKHAVADLKQSTLLMDIFIQSADQHFVCFLAGLILTIVLQSSTAVIGLMIALALEGLLPFESAFYGLLGDNIGTCITAVLASIGGTFAAKRLALAHTMFNVLGAVLAWFMAPLYLQYIPLLSSEIPRQIANAHTAFNIFNSILFISVVPLYTTLMMRLIPGEDYQRSENLYLDKNLLTTPALAINAAVKEMVVMAQVCYDMLHKIRDGHRIFDYKKYKELQADESHVDELQKNITDYLAQVTQGKLSMKESSLLPNLLHSVNDLERVGDHLENIANIFRRKQEGGVVFSEMAHDVVDKIMDNLDTMFVLTLTAMKSDDHEAARESFKVEERTNTLTKDAREQHMVWLRDGQSNADKFLVFNDAVIQMERIGDHLYNITQGIVHYGKR